MVPFSFGVVLLLHLPGGQQRSNASVSPSVPEYPWRQSLKIEEFDVGRLLVEEERLKSDTKYDFRSDFTRTCILNIHKHHQGTLLYTRKTSHHVLTRTHSMQPVVAT